MREIFTNCVSVKGLIPNIQKELIQPNSKKLSNPILKMGIRPEQTFSQRKYTSDQQIMKHSTLHLLGYRKKEKKVKSLSCVQLFVAPWTVAYQAPLSMGFSRQEYWSGVPISSPGDLPDPGIEPRSPALQADALLSEPQGKSSCQDGPYQKVKDNKCWQGCEEKGKLIFHG